MSCVKVRAIAAGQGGGAGAAGEHARRGVRVLAGNGRAVRHLAQGGTPRRRGRAGRGGLPVAVTKDGDYLMVSAVGGQGVLVVWL